MPNTYIPKTTPFDHQAQHTQQHWNAPARALFWEQGTGKTKPVIDTCGMLWTEGHIDAMLVVAPPGVERNWKSDELPAHMPDEILSRAMVTVYQSKRASTKWHQRELEKTLAFGGLSVLLISYNAFMTDKGKKFAKRFLTRRRCLYVLDEAHNIKSPGAKRTMTIVASGKYAPYRRVLTGTPVSQGPFDVYAPIRFLENDFWKQREFQDFNTFKHYFGEWLTAAEVRSEIGYDPGYDQLKGYRHLDELKSYVDVISDRVTKDEVLDLPPKLYSKRYHELTAEQQRLYDELKNDFSAEYDESTFIDAELAIVRLLRFQQIVCGYVGVDDEESPLRRVGNRNPRMELLEEIAQQTPHQGIIWARFREDINQIMDILPDAVRYDGSLDDDECERSKLAFQAGDAKWFVATPSKGGSGLTLNMAKTVIHYSNSFKLLDRQQSEDRAHRSGMDDNPVNYVDLCCPGTVDEHIIRNLRNKVDVASRITGDELREWL